ncbi:hypothetical protein D3C81_1289800 [compost metagenome]
MGITDQRIPVLEKALFFLNAGIKHIRIEAGKNRFPQTVQIFYRLQEDILHAETQRFGDIGHILGRGDHKDWRLITFIAQMLHQFKPVHARHRDITNHQIGLG